MTMIVDEYLDNQSVDNDDVFPCKGCGEVRYALGAVSPRRVPDRILTSTRSWRRAKLSNLVRPVHSFPV
jgi:hypothetical protein